MFDRFDPRKYEIDTELLIQIAIALGGALLSVRAMHASRGRTPDVMGATFATPAADHRAGGAWIITSLRVGDEQAPASPGKLVGGDGQLDRLTDPGHAAAAALLGSRAG